MRRALSPKGASRLRAWWPAILWATLVFAASATPGYALPALPGAHTDKLIHAGIYAILSALCRRGLARTSRLSSASAIIVAAAISTLYGISDEVHQAFTPMRTPDPEDALADALGSIAGAAVWAWRRDVAVRGHP